MRLRLVIVSSAATILLFACMACESAPAKEHGLLIMSYNLQTLFDPVDQGGEYDDFSVSKGSWNEDLYKTRIKALSAAILGASFPPGSGEGPDVLVVQEAENARVLRDLAAALGDYPYIIAAPEEESTLACGILSRIPVTASRAHRVRKPELAPASVPRFILEVELQTDAGRIIVMASHWKSKLGGAQETEPERQAAAALISSLVGMRLTADPCCAIIVAGDCNENPDEYERVEGAYPTAFMSPDAGPGYWLLITGSKEDLRPGSEPPILYCPWYESGGYSYRFQGNPERIDHLLLSPGLALGQRAWLTFDSFSAEPPEFLVSSSGQPLAWDTGSAKGYSDHLPIRVRLKYNP